jgi:amino acid adenylation domain-containing protein
MTAMLAGLKLGAAFIRIDAGWPKARVGFLLEDAAPQAIAADSSITIPLAFHDVPTVSLKGRGAPENPETCPDGSDRELYLMYTSGSTGVPKGVSVPQRAVHRLVVDADFMPMGEDLRFLHLAPQTFDASILEIWAPLLNGGCCVLYPEGTGIDLELLGRIIAGEGVNAMWLTASVFNHVIDRSPEVLKPLRYLLTGGEALSVPHVCRANRLLPDTQLINGYGPTENTTFTCCYSIPKDFPVSADSVPIGFPISGTVVQIGSESQEDGSTLESEGGSGELWAGGDGLALGYLNRPEETERRFIRDHSGQRWYRTGDRVSRGPDNALIFLGRKDDQVKVNGHRIELGEIDRCAANLPGVLEFRTIVRRDTRGGKLLAYYVGDANEQEVRAELCSQLPDFMVPARCIRLDVLPVNANGKLDRSRLPVLDSSRATVVEGGESLRDALATIWRETVSGIAAFGPDDNFFDVGGSSLELLEVVDRTAKHLGREIPVVKAFEYPTIRGFAHFLEKGEEHDGRSHAKRRSDRQRAALKQRRHRRSA